MKNTYAVFMLTIGGIMLYSGYQGWTIADTVRFFTGQPLQDAKTLVATQGDLGVHNEDGTPKDLPTQEEYDAAKPKSVPNQVNPNGDKELNPNGGILGG